MPDPIFAEPRLADVYDGLDGERDDLDHYESLVEELGARSVLDVGCGTGSLAVRLARRGVAVTGVDPAAASLAVARRKPGADRVRWIEGDATTLPAGLRVDLAVMTGNVAQVFTTDEAWAANLAGIHAALAPHGHLVFETRRPEARAWERWDGQRVRTDGVESWCEVLDVSAPLVTFRWSFRFTGTDGRTGTDGSTGTDGRTGTDDHTGNDGRTGIDGGTGSDGETLTSESTLRFRTRAEVERSLADAGFAAPEVRDAPDRPGLEMVFVTTRPG